MTNVAATHSTPVEMSLIGLKLADPQTHRAYTEKILVISILKIDEFRSMFNDCNTI